MSKSRTTVLPVWYTMTRPAVSTDAAEALCDRLNEAMEILNVLGRRGVPADIADRITALIESVERLPEEYPILKCEVVEPCKSKPSK